MLSLFDYLNWGPIDCSLADRVAWLDEHSPYEDSWAWLIETVDRFLEEARAVERPVIWVAPRSANELSALFWYAHHLGLDHAEMKIADLLLVGGWRTEPPLSLGELPVEVLGLVFDRPSEPWDSSRFPVDTWARLVREGAFLRVVANGRLESAPSDRFDERLLRNCRADWTPWHRIVGHTMGQAADDGDALDDSFLRWRLSELVHSGKLELDGSLAVHGVANAAKLRRVA